MQDAIKCRDGRVTARDAPCLKAYVLARAAVVFVLVGLQECETIAKAEAACASANTSIDGVDRRYSRQYHQCYVHRQP
jgi:hypothetical protein